MWVDEKDAPRVKHLQLYRYFWQQVGFCNRRPNALLGCPMFEEVNEDFDSGTHHQTWQRKNYPLSKTRITAARIAGQIENNQCVR